MPEIDLAYLPVVGRGAQINIICAMHGIKVNSLMSNPMGADFNKDTQAPFGTVPWMKDHGNGLELNDSLAIVQYLVTKYQGPLSPSDPDHAAQVAMYWHMSPCVGTCGHTWPYVAVHGQVWPYMATCGHTWPCMAMYGHTWPCMAMH